MSHYRFLLPRAALAMVAIAIGPCALHAHELWIESAPAAKVGQEQEVRICFGHAGSTTPAELLEKYNSRLSAAAVQPDGSSQRLPVALGDDSYTARFVPTTPGCHVLGAALQVGIIDDEFHGIPANTRIVMYGKSVIRAGAGSEGYANPLGFELEIVPVTDPAKLRAGEVVTVKLLLRGKPIGGREVVVALGTAGPKGPFDDPRVQSSQWSLEAHADPRTGEASFPLIVGGRHVFSIRYLDETAGTYQGELEEVSDFSHLRKGDRFEQTMYMATFTVDVSGP